MKFRDFTVTFVAANDERTPFPEIQDEKTGQWYVVGQEGAEFEINVQSAIGPENGSHPTVSLKVQGEGVGYCHAFRWAYEQYNFRGFPEEDYFRRFVFAPSSAANAPDLPLEA